MSVKRIALLYAVLAACAAGAQVLPEPTGPGDLVLPPIVLEVEDLSEVHIEARLPPEEDLVPPDRRFPLPQPGVLAIGEPSIPSPVPGGAGQPAGAAGGPLATQAAFGAGTLRGMSASVQVSAEGTPGLDVSFRHESLDGFGYDESTPPERNLPGSGFDLRDDLLTAAVALNPWGADLALEGSWHDRAQGLQRHGGTGGYTSLDVRTIGGAVSLSGKPVHWLTLAGGLEAANDELVLAGAVPFEISELGVAPSLSGTAAFGHWTIGLAARYAFHAGTLITDPFVNGHRFRTDLTAGVELAPGWQAEAGVGWHWTGEGTSAVPFHFGLSGTPLSFLTFSLRGGYRVVPVDLADVLAASQLLMPAPTVDSEGWFGTLDMTLGVGGAISATAGLSYATESAMLDADGTVDVDTALYPLYPAFQRAADGLKLTGGLRWSLAAWLTLNASLAVNLPDRPWYEPAATLNVELTALEESGRMGATVSAASEAGSSGFPLPRLDLGGFLRISPAVRLRLDASDLLGPLAGPRFELGDYQRPGLRVIGTVQVEF
jgi:hypothetical protein